MDRVKIIKNISIKSGSKYYGIGETIEGLEEKEIKRLEKDGYVKVLGKSDFETSEIKLKEKERELVDREKVLKEKENKYSMIFDISLEEFEKLVLQKTVGELKEISKSWGEELQNKNKAELTKEFIAKTKGKSLCLKIN